MELIVTSKNGNRYPFAATRQPRARANVKLEDLYTGLEFAETVEVELGNVEQLKMLAKNAGINPSALHIHHGCDKKPYVCYPGRIKDHRMAKSVFRAWAMVTAVQIEDGIEPNHDLLLAMFALKSEDLYSAINVVYEWYISQGWRADFV